MILTKPRILYFWLLLSCLTSLGWLSPGYAASLPTKPNILLILVDDIGVGDFGFSGGQDFPTPNIDRLAASGVVFTDGYVLPSCAPTRAALLTGRYPQRLGIEDNRPLDGPRDGLDVSQVLLPQMLRTVGYHTQLIGKWHLGKGDRWEFAPRNRGFDDFFGYFGAAGQYLNPPFYHNGVEKKYAGYNTDILTDEACTYIRQRAKQSVAPGQRSTPPPGKPFFLHLAYTAAHLKQEAKPEDLARFPQLEGKRKMAAAIISNLDQNIGRLTQTLKETGLSEQTLIFFLSDNGAEPSVLGTMNGPHRGQKFDVLEGGIRVPFTMCWPGRIPSGTHYRHMVHAVDVFATALATAEIKRPENIDGADLLPFVLGKNAGTPHERLFWLFNDHKEWRIPGRDTNLARPLRAIREGHFKLVMEGTNAPELYDLSTDPGEVHNLAVAQPARVASMKNAFEGWRTQMKPQVIADDHPLYGRYKTMKP
jgi:arylsulfatase A-like enzyme